MATLGTILLVDDEPLVLEMFEELFVAQGFDVGVAASADDAVALIDRSYFDAIVCDVMMEGLDGFDLLTLARRKNNDIAFVLITGAPSKTDEERAHELDAAYLSKPVSLKELLATLDTQMNKTQKKRVAVARTNGVVASAESSQANDA